MNIGIFSGSFNPIHVGHLILGNYMSEFADVDEVWYLVSPHNPLKENKTLLDENERLEMVKKALEPYPKLKARDFEFSLSRPSFTINTLAKLQEAYPEHEFTLIIGADNWADFDKWRDPEKIIETYDIKIYPRLGSSISIPPRLRKKVETIDSPIIEISSTFIRSSIAEGKNVKSFLPPDVYEYIVERGFYR